ncbi:MAG: phosphonoacetaldehyde reductase [Planctomycetes bacterium]|nr:phosphonoacetaldehyde reductase [Planctomycetota bacterium]
MIQKEYIGFGSIGELEFVLAEYSAKRIFLVTAHDSYELSGAKGNLDKIFAGCQVQRFYDFSSNPKIEDVNKGLEAFKKIRPDVVIGVGGGSVIDMAKLINFFASNELEPSEYLKNPESKINISRPLIAIPTTAGSGSEATAFAVLYIDKEKFSIDNEFVLPDVAIVDPDLTTSLPEYITAVTGMDALCQAIESYWCINSTDESKEFAKKAIELVMKNLKTAVNNPDRNSRLAMARAANLAGKAINITKTTAPHAISYPLTSYFGIAHGHAVALTLPAMLEYNAAVTDEDLLDNRGCDYVKKTINEIANILGCKNVDEAKEKITKLMENIGLETGLSKIKTKKDIVATICDGFNQARAANNPRKVTKQALREILRAVR